MAFHSSLTKKQEAALERCQAVSLRIILQEMYISYEAALEMTGLAKLSQRRLDRCKSFAQKSIKHENNKRLFPLNDTSDQGCPNLRNKEVLRMNFARTKVYKNNTIPFCQRLLNQLQGGEEEQRRGPGV